MNVFKVKEITVKKEERRSNYCGMSVLKERGE